MTPATIHGWCGRLNDPDHGQPCPCVEMAGTAPAVQQRHRAATNRAHVRDWDRRNPTRSTR